LLKEFILAFIVSIDIYLATAACCNSGIRIPLGSALTIDLFSASVLWLSVTLSDFISRFVSSHTIHIIGTVVLIAIGTLNISKSLLRNIIRRISDKDGISLKIGNLSLFIQLCLDDTAVDMDCSKVLSVGEASVLALAGSLDAAATGLSCGGGDISAFYALISAIVCGASALMLGSVTGRKISSLRHDLSWTGGLLLILFAVFTA
jgi:putative sporulation protein YtaF